MWKFRQHLLKHHTGPSSKNQRQQRDHMYAEYPPPSDGDEQQPSGSSHSSTQASETVAQKQNDPYPKNHGLAKDHSYGTRKRGNKDYFGSTTSQVQGSDEHLEDEEDTDDQIVTPGADDGSRTKFDHLYSAKKRKGAASKSGSRSKRMAAKKSSYRALNRAKQEAQVKR